MSANSIGKNLTLTSFGESHGPFIGSVLDGFPAGMLIDLKALQHQLNRRRPGQSALTTSRTEKDSVQIISGVFEGKTLGTPITFLIPNLDQKPQDYEALKTIYRPGHADALWDLKMGHRDYRGGGRSSARITAGWVAAGTLAEQFLSQYQMGPIKVCAWVQQIHTIQAHIPNLVSREEIDKSPVRCPDLEKSSKMESAILEAKENGDSLGGTIRVRISGVPAGTGEPVFRKLQAQISQYMLNLNAVKGIYFGDDNQAHERFGSENNDSWISENGKIGTETNHSGGIVGGMATGSDITFELYFKPTSTIKKEQTTINHLGESVTLSGEGRHDPCVLPRAVPIVESLSALAIMDLLLDPVSRL